MYLFISFVYLFFAAGQIQFLSRNHGKTVRGLVGSSVNFTWIFSNGVETVTWGLKRNDFVGVDSDKILVSLSKSGLVPALVPLKYTGRVSGSRSDDLLSG